MASDNIWERALQRYADTVYRLALLRDPHPRRAAHATAAAFLSLPWQNLQMDDRLEGRLIAALPPLRRFRIGRRLAPIPSAFWQLPPSTRVALGLRLLRGYTGEQIAPILGCTPDEAHQVLL